MLGIILGWTRMLGIILWCLLQWLTIGELGRCREGIVMFFCYCMAIMIYAYRHFAFCLCIKGDGTLYLHLHM